MAAPTHACPGGCGTQVAHHMLACKPCWSRLPKPYRDAVNDSYRRDSRSHRSAMAAALAWYRDNPASEAGQ